VFIEEDLLEWLRSKYTSIRQQDVGQGGKTVYRSTGTNDKEKAQEIADKVKAQSWDQINLDVKPRYL
jgi:hypothetical protein